MKNMGTLPTTTKNKNNLTQKRPTKKKNWNKLKCRWFLCWRHMRKDSANVKCIKLRRTKRKIAWEGKCNGWIAPVTQTPQIQSTEITENIVDGRLQKEKEDVHREHLRVARCDRYVLFTATSTLRWAPSEGEPALSNTEKRKSIRNRWKLWDVCVLVKSQWQQTGPRKPFHVMPRTVPHPHDSLPCVHCPCTHNTLSHRINQHCGWLSSSTFRVEIAWAKM